MLALGNGSRGFAEWRDIRCETAGHFAVVDADVAEKDAVAVADRDRNATAQDALGAVAQAHALHDRRIEADGVHGRVIAFEVVQLVEALGYSTLLRRDSTRSPFMVRTVEPVGRVLHVDALDVGHEF